MAEAIREIVYRDGCVTDAALIAEGFTTAEIIEWSAAAQRHANWLLNAAGRRADRVPDIIAKIARANVHDYPMTAGTPDTLDRRLKWSSYCNARTALAIDPWCEQAERCRVLLRQFLKTLPLLPSEVDRILAAKHAQGCAA